MPLTRRRFAQAMASALLFRHLPGIAQTPLTFAIGHPPEGNIIRRVVSAGAPADVLLLAVAPEKLVGFSSLISRARRRFASPSIRALPKLGRLAGRASTLSLEGLLALHPDLVVDCGNADETWLSQARQVSAQTRIPWLLINGELRQTPEQLQAAGQALGMEARTAAQSALAQRFIAQALAFSTRLLPVFVFMRREAPRSGDGITGIAAYGSGRVAGITPT